MAYVLETGKEESPARPADGFVLSDLWMLPFLVLALIFDKFRRHLARLGQDLDLAALSYDPEPPETFQPPMPRSALSMHRRLEDLARFHADLKRYIRRHATRIAARTSFARPDPNPANPANLLSGPNPDPANFQTAIPNFRLARPVAIRGPPAGWMTPDLIRGQSTIPDLSELPARPKTMSQRQSLLTRV